LESEKINALESPQFFTKSSNVRSKIIEKPTFLILPNAITSNGYISLDSVTKQPLSAHTFSPTPSKDDNQLNDLQAMKLPKKGN